MVSRIGIRDDAIVRKDRIRRKALADNMPEQRHQRIEIALQIDDDNRLRDTAQLRGHNDFEEFVERTYSAGQQDKRVRHRDHALFALLQIRHDDEFVGRFQRRLEMAQELRQDTDNRSARRARSTRRLAHQANIAATKDQAKTLFADERAQSARPFRVGRVVAVRRAAEHTNRGRDTPVCMRAMH